MATESPERRFLERLRKITDSLEILVDIVDRETFLETFKTLHGDNCEKYKEEKAKQSIPKRRE